MAEKKIEEFPPTEQTLYRINGTLMRIAQALEGIEEALKQR